MYQSYFFHISREINCQSLNVVVFTSKLLNVEFFGGNSKKFNIFHLSNYPDKKISILYKVCEHIAGSSKIQNIKYFNTKI